MKNIDKILLFLFSLVFVFIFTVDSIEARPKKRKKKKKDQTEQTEQSSSKSKNNKNKIEIDNKEKDKEKEKSEPESETKKETETLKSNDLNAKNAIRYGVTYFSDNLNTVINSNNNSLPSDNIQGYGVSISYLNYFKKKTGYVRTGISYDFGKNISYTQNDENINRSIKPSRYEIPICLGAIFGTSLASFYIGGGVELLNYKLLIDTKTKDNLNQDLSYTETYSSKGFLNFGYGFTYHAGLTIEVNKKTRFYTEINFVEAAIKVDYSYTNVLKQNISNFQAPPNIEIFITPRSTRLYFGFENFW